MKKSIVILMAACLPMFAGAQSALDAYVLSQSDFRGTARYMAMGGAFTALGGDLSTLNQNPAGLGVYRSNEIGLTLGLDIMSTKSLTQGYSESKNKTRFLCNNFGYAGAVYTGNDIMPYFSWGASYARAANFNRSYRGQIGQLNGSLSNYIAGYTSAENWSSGDLTGGENFNPYLDNYAPWMSILAYNSYMINPITDSKYSGLWQNGTSGYGTFDVNEKGYIDEYSIDFGGNICDVVFWGIGFGITDIDYTSSVYYTEDMHGANIPSFDGYGQYDGTTTGDGGFGLDSWKYIRGNGFNFKAGLIFKPINELRIGIAVHTPTYYNLKQEGWAGTDYGYSTEISGTQETNDGYTDYFEWKLRTPWRLLAGVSGVIGKQAILSLDYEYRPTQDMSVLDSDGDKYNDVCGDVKNYYNAMSIIRLGAEYRLDRHWSLRAGFQYQTSPSKSEAIDGKMPIYTSGPDDTETTPSYSFDKATRYITCGVGYRYQNFYLDAAYVNKHRESSWRGYTPNDYTDLAPSSKITANDSQVVISAGFKF